MTRSTGCGGCGSNYEFQGTLRPAVVGVFDLFVRFSTDEGLTWTYADQDAFYAGESGTDLPGVLTVRQSDDPGRRSLRHPRVATG